MRGHEISRIWSTTFLHSLRIKLKIRSKPIKINKISRLRKSRKLWALIRGEMGRLGGFVETQMSTISGRFLLSLARKRCWMISSLGSGASRSIYFIMDLKMWIRTKTSTRRIEFGKRTGTWEIFTNKLHNSHIRSTGQTRWNRRPRMLTIRGLATPSL